MADAHLTDPLDRVVRLHDSTWYAHILKGHPDMAPFRTSVEKAITGPVAIHLSTSDADCRLYYGDEAGPGLTICVVADVQRGFVKTAYRARRIKPGEREWPQPNPSKE